MIYGMIQSGKLDDIVKIEVPEILLVNSQVLKKKLPEFFSISAGRPGVNHVRDGSFGRSQQKSVAFFGMKRDTVRKHTDGNIAVSKQTERSSVALFAALAAGGRGKGKNSFRNQIVPGQREFKGQA